MSIMVTAELVGAGGSFSDGGTKNPMVKLLVQNGLQGVGADLLRPESRDQGHHRFVASLTMLRMF